MVRRFDLENFRPRLICVEADDKNRHFFTKVLQPCGCSVHAYTRSNTFFLAQMPPALSQMPPDRTISSASC